MTKSSPLFFIPILLGMAAFAASPASQNDENENYRQLQSMPRERRVALLDNLERFDKLGPIEQAKIRKLDAEISSKDPVDQLRYRSLMRSYQLWLSGLTEEQKDQLRSTDDPDTRFNLALKFRKEQLKASSSARRIHGIRLSYFGLKGPYNTAQLLRIWNKMNSAQKAKAESHEKPHELEREIWDIRQSVGVKIHPFPSDDEKHYLGILDADEDLKKLIGIYRTKAELDKVKKPNPNQTTAEAEKAKKAEDTRHRTASVFAQFLYFEDEAHKPKAVKQENLEKFSAFCPAWFHAMIDPLSADDARNYLTIIYRLIFPEGQEITADWKPAKEKAAGTAGAARPPAKRSGTGAPL